MALTAAATAREENLKGSVTQLEAAATSARTALDTERSRADQLATSATESSEKDKQIEALKRFTVNDTNQVVSEVSLQVAGTPGEILLQPAAFGPPPPSDAL